MGLVMYIKPGCPYCQAAREHFAAEGDLVEERDATASDQWKAELMTLTNNRGVGYPLRYPDPRRRLDQAAFGVLRVL